MVVVEGISVLFPLIETSIGCMKLYLRGGPLCHERHGIIHERWRDQAPVPKQSVDPRDAIAVLRARPVVRTGWSQIHVASHDSRFGECRLQREERRQQLQRAAN